MSFDRLAMRIALFVLSAGGFWPLPGARRPMPRPSEIDVESTTARVSPEDSEARTDADATALRVRRCRRGIVE